ncbi:MAG: ABC transporter ATP-binding protein [bacterium]|nr:ABC transporter ATP-binding protein [bacterium]
MLKIENLSKTYPGGVHALKNVSLEIPRGMFGLLGPNGAGKSTLMRTIATLQEADEGTISFGDLDVLKDKEEVRKILGYLPQEFGVYPRISAGRMLDHFAVLKGLTNAKDRKSVVEHLLQMTNLYEKRKQNLSTFSGGMKQRFGIAQALLGDPRLIIVDEPTAGLDPEERNRFLNLLSEIGENVVVILSTHIVEDVSDLCQRLAVISDGTVRLTGEPGEIVDKLQGKIWRKLIDKHELESHHAELAVISTRWQAGQMEIHVFSDEALDSGFEQVDADLKDAYFSTLNVAEANVAEAA